MTNESANEADRTANLLDQVVRLLAVQVRLQIETQNDAILTLSDAGFGPSRIAELLGTTPNTVNVALSKARSAIKKSGSSTKTTKR